MMGAALLYRADMSNARKFSTKCTEIFTTLYMDKGQKANRLETLRPSLESLAIQPHEDKSDQHARQHGGTVNIPKE